MKLGLHTINIWFGMLMIIIVVAGAIAFTFTDFMIEKINGPKRYGFAILFVAYAIYRGVRIYQTLKYRKEE